MLKSVEGKGKNQLQPGHESMGDTSVLLHCSVLKKSFTKTDIYVLEHCCESETKCWFSIYRGDSKRKKGVSLHLFIQSNNTVNYTSY
jgi:hypothetical protein